MPICLLFFVCAGAIIYIEDVVKLQDLVERHPFVTANVLHNTLGGGGGETVD